MSKPIWLRQPSEVTEEDYTKFYKSLSQVIQYSADAKAL